MTTMIIFAYAISHFSFTITSVSDIYQDVCEKN